MFNSIIDTTTGITFSSVMACTAVSLVLGLAIAFVYMSYDRSFTKNFVVTLVILPALVQIVIMMVNGNLGAGVAVMGAFSLVRFRSVPGSSREIANIFFTMAVGLATGMGYLGFAAIFTIVICGVLFILYKTSFASQITEEKELRITIPENLDYSGIFDDLFSRYTIKTTLDRVKSTNMGSMFELRYVTTLKNARQEKEFLDAIRCRNGNLTVMCGRIQSAREEL